MSKSTDLKVVLSRPVCLPGISEDDLRTLVEALKIPLENSVVGNLVRATEGSTVTFKFGSDGSFQGTFAKLNGEQVNLIPGSNSLGLHLFKGPPGPNNPGPGWQIELELTQRYFNQSGPELNWEIFLASRVSVLNN